MESQPQDPEFRNNPESFHPCIFFIFENAFHIRYTHAYDQLKAVTGMIPASEFLIPCCDWNGHVGSTGSDYKDIHGGYGKPDPVDPGICTSICSVPW